MLHCVEHAAVDNVDEWASNFDGVATGARTAAQGAIAAEGCSCCFGSFEGSRWACVRCFVAEKPPHAMCKLCHLVAPRGRRCAKNQTPDVFDSLEQSEAAVSLPDFLELRGGESMTEVWVATVFPDVVDSIPADEGGVDEHRTAIILVVLGAMQSGCTASEISSIIHVRRPALAAEIISLVQPLLDIDSDTDPAQEWN